MDLLTVCLNSFYMSFLIVILLKTGLMFVALKYSDGDLKDMFKLMFMFDMVVFFTLPLLIMMGRGIC